MLLDLLENCWLEQWSFEEKDRVNSETTLKLSLKIFLLFLSLVRLDSTEIDNCFKETSPSVYFLILIKK